MARSLIPFVFSDFPTLEEEFQEFSPFTGKSSDVTISEDDHNIYVEAHMPGIHPEEVEITFHQGTLYIKGERQETEEDKKRKYYRKATRSFSYRVSVPADVDENTEPEATCRHGEVKVRFQKQKKSQPRKISVREK